MMNHGVAAVTRVDLLCTLFCGRGLDVTNLTSVISIYLPGAITFSHLTVKKWSLAWAVASALHTISTPHSTSVSVPLYAITARSIATPYSTSVSVPLYDITARSITNQRASSGVGIGFTFLPHVIVPDKRHGVHCLTYTKTRLYSNITYTFRKGVLRMQNAVHACI
jgi:hypothetical protein